MNHTFNVTIAERYGIEEAILLEHLYWWIHKNECDDIEEMVKDGKVWCRSTANGFTKYIPYMNPQKIRRVLVGLEKMGKICIGNFNVKATNQTLWYSFSEDFVEEMVALGYDFSKMKNGIFKNEKSNINNINLINKENIIIEDNSLSQHAREDELTKEGKTLYDDQLWKETIGMNHHLSLFEVNDFITDFILDCRCNGMERHENVKDLKSHFNNWLKNRKYANNRSNNNARRPSPEDNIRTVENGAMEQIRRCLSGEADRELERISEGLPF